MRIRNFIKRPYLVALSLASLLLFSACKNLGVNSIRSNRGAYIEALAQTDKEEMLANIVRAKYNDPPVFLKIKTISAAPSLEIKTGAETSTDFSGVYGLLTPGFTYTEAPSILYVPTTGSEYSNLLMMPMGLTNLFLMLNNGFNFRIVSDLMLRSINEKSNSRNTNDSTREEFARITDALGRLLENRLLIFGFTTNSGNSSPAIVVKVLPEALRTDDYKYLTEELGLTNDAELIEFKLGFEKNQNVVSVNTRSFLSIINYLSNFVEVPEKHKNMVWQSTFNLQNAPFQIYSSPSLPQNANTAVYLYKTWFYIKADDLRSQNVLYLIKILFDLQANVNGGGDNIQLSFPVR